MPKKRRKLDKNFERVIYSAKKRIELILAKIYDINDEDIQKEYMSAFGEVVNLFESLSGDYDEIGFNENSELLNKKFQDGIAQFESDYVDPDYEFSVHGSIYCAHLFPIVRRS